MSRTGVSQSSSPNESFQENTPPPSPQVIYSCSRMRAINDPSVIREQKQAKKAKKITKRKSLAQKARDTSQGNTTPPPPCVGKRCMRIRASNDPAVIMEQRVEKMRKTIVRKSLAQTVRATNSSQATIRRNNNNNNDNEIRCATNTIAQNNTIDDVVFTS